jgi:hypothetical protein
MRLSDIVGHWDLATYPMVAMVIFLAVFVLVAGRVYFTRGGRDLRRHAWMAIEDEHAAARVADAGKEE